MHAASARRMRTPQTIRFYCRARQALTVFVKKKSPPVQAAKCGGIPALNPWTSTHRLHRTANEGKVLGLRRAAVSAQRSAVTSTVQD